MPDTCPAAIRAQNVKLVTLLHGQSCRCKSGHWISKSTKNTTSDRCVQKSFPAVDCLHAFRKVAPLFPLLHIVVAISVVWPCFLRPHNVNVSHPIAAIVHGDVRLDEICFRVTITAGLDVKWELISSKREMKRRGRETVNKIPIELLVLHDVLVEIVFSHTGVIR